MTESDLFSLYEPIPSFVPLAEDPAGVKKRAIAVTKTIETAVRNGKTFSATKSLLEYPILSVDDEEYVIRIFRSFALACFQKDFDEFDSSFKKEKLEPLQELLKEFPNFLVLKNFLSTFKSIPSLESCFKDNLFKSGEQQTILADIWQQCFDLYQRNRDINAQEIEFIQVFEHHVTQLFTESSGEVNCICDLQIIKESVTLKDLVTNINSSPKHATDVQNARHCDLRTKLQNVISESNSEFRKPFQKILQSLLEEYRAQPKVGVITAQIDQNHKIFQIKSSGITLDRVLVEYQKLTSKPIILEFRVYASKHFIVNQSKTGKGENWVVASPIVTVLAPEKMWNLSGADSSREGQRALDGKSPGEDGADGACGSPGESGGNLLFLCDRIEGARNLKIISNGGNGGDGEDGGNGARGADGKDGTSLVCKTEDELGSEIVSVTTLDEIKNFCSKWDPQEVRHDDSGTWLFTKSDKFVTGKYRNMDATLIHYRSTFMSIWHGTLILIKGLPGSDGTPGGNGGSSGAGGQGGYPGVVELRGIQDSECMGSDEVVTETIPGNEGRDGAPGQPGKGGRNGNRGADWGRVETDKKTFPWHGSLSLFRSHDQKDNRVWTGLHNQYYGIEESGSWPPQESRQRPGKKASKKQNQRRGVKKRVILEEEISKEMNKVLKNSVTKKIQDLTKQQEKEEVALEQNLEETEISQTQRVCNAKVIEVMREVEFVVPKPKMTSPTETLPNGLVPF